MVVAETGASRFQGQGASKGGSNKQPKIQLPPEEARVRAVAEVVQGEAISDSACLCGIMHAPFPRHASAHQRRAKR